MARVTSVIERRADAGERRVAPGATRYALFAALCAAADALVSLPEDEREQHAEVIGWAIELGWREGVQA